MDTCKNCHESAYDEELLECKKCGKHVHFTCAKTDYVLTRLLVLFKMCTYDLVTDYTYITDEYKKYKYATYKPTNKMFNQFLQDVQSVEFTNYINELTELYRVEVEKNLSEVEKNLSEYYEPDELINEQLENLEKLDIFCKNMEKFMKIIKSSAPVEDNDDEYEGRLVNEFSKEIYADFICHAEYEIDRHDMPFTCNMCYRGIKIEY